MILVSSLGGCGTTFFIKWLKEYKNVNDPHDKDGLKHLTYPLDRNNIEKCVYIYSKKPEEQALSLINRGYAIDHVKKLSKSNKNVNQITDLLDYKNDPFDFQKVLEQWLNSKSRYDIVFIDYTQLWNNLENIFEFLNIDKKYIRDFPKQKSRSNTINSIKDENLKNHIINIYKDYNNFLKELPNFYIKRKTTAI